MATTCPICRHPVEPAFAKDGFQFVRCRGCGLGFLDPLPAREYLRAFYNRENYYCSDTVGYFDYAILETGLKRMYGRFLRGLARRYGFDVRGKAVLDVGCAYGFFLDTARAAGAATLWGNDISTDGAATVTGKGYGFVPGPFEDADFEGRRFDLVFMGDVFEHLRDPAAAVERLRGLVVEGGLVMLSTVDFGSAFARILGRRWRLVIPPQHVYLWTARALALLFTGHGFAGGCHRYWLHLPARYLAQRFKAQFGFSPWGLTWLPVRTLPVPSFDTMLCVFRRG